MQELKKFLEKNNFSKHLNKLNRIRIIHRNVRESKHKIFKWKNIKDKYKNWENKEKKGRFIMSTINITNARKDLYNLVESVNLYHEPTLIVGKKANAVLISEDDWSAIQETLYLDSIPGMTQSILEGANETLDNCISEDMVKW